MTIKVDAVDTNFKVNKMSDSLGFRTITPPGVDKELLPHKIEKETETNGEIKERSGTSCAFSPFKHSNGTARYWIKPCCEYKGGKTFVVAYEVSVSIPGAVCGLNALLQNDVYSAAKLANHFLQHWLLKNGVPVDVVKKFTLSQCELQAVHLTYLIYSESKKKANDRILEIAERGSTLFSEDVIKKNKRKAVVDYRKSDRNSYIKISKSSKFDIAAYVKSWIPPKSFCGLSSAIAEDIFDISKNYVRFEAKLKKAWFSETVIVEDVDGNKVKIKRPSKWISPLSWKGKDGEAMYEQVFEEARALLRLNEKLNKRMHKLGFMRTLSDEHCAILKAHYAGTRFHDLPFKSEDAKQRSKVKRVIQKLCGVDLSIPWVEQKKLVQLPWLLYPGMFNLKPVPKALHDHAFAGATIKKKLNEMKEKLREQAKLNRMSAHSSAFHHPAEHSVSPMADAEFRSDLLGKI